MVEQLAEVKKIQDDPMKKIRDRIMDFSLEEKTEAEFNTSNPPPFVKMRSSYLRYREVENDYYVDAGNWSVGWAYEGSTLRAVSNAPALHNVELVPCTKNVWFPKNKEYYNGD